MHDLPAAKKNSIKQRQQGLSSKKAEKVQKPLAGESNAKCLRDIG